MFACSACRRGDHELCFGDVAVETIRFPEGTLEGSTEECLCGHPTDDEIEFARKHVERHRIEEDKRIDRNDLPFETPDQEEGFE